MKATLSEREGNEVKLAVEVSGDELQGAFDDRLRQLSREVRVPGFRQGKVPVTIVRQRLGDEAILVDAIEEAMTGWFTTAMDELGLDPVDRPQIEVGEEAPELGKPFGFTASVTVMPEVVLGRYKGVEAPTEEAEVQDEEVDAQVERLRNELAELRPVGGRPVQQGDFVTVDLHSALDGSEVDGLEASDFTFEVGGGRVFAELEEHAVGMSAGDERTFALELPEDYAKEDLAGKTVDITLNLKEIKEKVLPRLSDKWASEVSEFRTLLELRLEIRKKLEAAKKHAAEQLFRSLAVKAVTDDATLDLPEVVIREQAEEIVSDFKRSLESRGTSLEAYFEATGTSLEQMIEDMKPRAAANVKTGLVLDAVAKAEGIEASADEVSAAVGQVAASGRVDTKEFESRLRKSGRIEAFKWQIVRDKAADFIVANAVAVSPPAEEPPAEEPAEEPPAEEPPAEKPAEEPPAEEPAESTEQST